MVRTSTYEIGGGVAGTHNKTHVEGEVKGGGGEGRRKGGGGAGLR